jgi:hypothetical protein
MPPRSLGKCHSTEFTLKERCILSDTTRKLVQVFSAITLAIALTTAAFVGEQPGTAQHRRKQTPARAPKSEVATAESVERAIAAVCKTRHSDPRVTISIDDMARTAPVSLSDPRVIEAHSRAQRLLTIAKRLIPFAVKRVSIDNGLEPLNLRWIITRVQLVKNIRPDVAARDNAAWRPSEPDTIQFGTIFLLGLRSDEAMIAVLGHELTHAINGTDQGLQPIFTRVGVKANHVGRPVGLNATMELTCELVGLEVARDYISQTKEHGISSRQRLARALQKDCVATDQSDENHLSPRETMRSLINLQPSLISLLPTATSRKPAKKQSGKPTKGRSPNRKKR